MQTPPERAQGRFIRMQSADRFVAKSHTLKTLVEAAYELPAVAKTPGGVRPELDAQMAMLRALLADRFRLSIHRVRKELPVFTPGVAKDGPKFREADLSKGVAPEGPPPLVFVIDLPVVQMHGRDATIAELASVMQRAALGRPRWTGRCWIGPG